MVLQYQLLKTVVRIDIPTGFPALRTLFPLQRNTFARRTYSLAGTPFDDSNISTEDAIKQTLKNDPNLEGFFTDGKIENTSLRRQDNHVDANDGFDLSDIPMLSANDIDPIQRQMQNQLGQQQMLLSNSSFTDMNEPVTMNTEEFIKRFRGDSSFNENAVTHKDHIPQLQQEPVEVNSLKETISSSFRSESFDLYLDFIEKGDTFQESPSTNIRLSEIVSTPSPLIIISKFQDPKLNLSIEKYVYDKLPNPKDHKAAKRLLLYKNSPCVVIGKNQNPFKEINFRYASLLQIPIIRRYSGGGTVVHDLGNLNFSYITSQTAFDRIGFSTALNSKINDLVGLKHDTYQMPLFPLTTNKKGDIVNASNEKKISGSAFQISRGRALHHGTMLLNSDLKTLSKLLKLSESRKASIKDKSTDSIPSPVQNMYTDEEVFKYCAVNSFISKDGEDESAISQSSDYDNLKSFTNDGKECQILKLDDINELPKEVLGIYKNFHKWEWTIGRTPKFEFEFKQDDLEVKFLVDKGYVKEVQLNKYEPAFDDLISEVASSFVPFRSDVICGLINEDEAFRHTIGWNIDFNIDYKNLGVTM